MSATDRQNRLLVAEDWKRIYQTFRNADFQSYDFDTLRRTMIAYLRENYPEDFNDYIESSEYLALIDLIAYLGQNLSFRGDLNARENYLELAERRESILRLARLVAYNPRRNQAANGVLKITAVQTTEDIFDGNNINLSNQTVLWNDPSNDDWFEQFIKIINSAFTANNKFGNPASFESVDGIPTELYKFAGINNDVPVYGFTKPISGASTQFEVTSCYLNQGSIQEEPPFVGNALSLLYRDDGKGAASTNTGFFCHFRQGTLQNGNFVISNPSTNQIVNINATNINNSDVWLYSLDSNGIETTLWNKVDSLQGNNVVYNSLNNGNRNIFNVLTKADDRIDIAFGDGVFGNLPKGQFKVYYRSSANRNFQILPREITNVNLVIPYVNAQGSIHNLSITLALQYVVSNATTTESNESIKRNAPATYYTQNRLITAEDYNIGPLATNQQIVKVKSVNRNASGISRYFDLRDSTGKYSNTNIFADDGIIYRQEIEEKRTFTFNTRTDIENLLYNTITPIIKDPRTRSFYYKNYSKILITEDRVWTTVTDNTNQVTGYFTDQDDLISPVGTFTSSNLRYLESGALVKFIPPEGYHFMGGQIMEGNPVMLGSSSYKWVRIISVENDGTAFGTGILENGDGPIVINDSIPSNSTISEIRPKFTTALTDDVLTKIIDLMFANKTFGLRYDFVDRSWKIILGENLNVIDSFSLGKAGDTTNTNQDSSWFIVFETDGINYTITNRLLEYVFESEDQVRFYFENKNKVFDTKTGNFLSDSIKVLNINNQPDNTIPFTVDWQWQIEDCYKNSSGYIDSRKLKIGFFDSDNDGVIDDPDLFDHIVEPTVNSNEKFIIQKRIQTIDNTEDYSFVNAADENITIYSNQEEASLNLTKHVDGDKFYFANVDLFKIYEALTGKFTIINDYRAYIGRSGLKFQYNHTADQTTRIDPSVSNLIDTYLLTRDYDTSFRQYLSETNGTKPLPLSSDQLYLNFSGEINKIKSISDEVIYHPVKYKVLFGEKAEPTLQARIKVVKNPDIPINDNQIKSQVINYINLFFSLDNWDFGDTFYFQEMATYIISNMTPQVLSVVLVPVDKKQFFGSMFEVKSENDEILISGATVNDIDIITSNTASQLRAEGNIEVNSSSNTGISSGGSY
jgi:hypothetical protein